MLSGSGSSATGRGGRCFFCPPKDHERPEDFKKPDELDLGIGGTGMSGYDLLFEVRHSSCPPKSAEDGAVDALLWRDELSVEAVLVVLDEPLPLPL